MQIKRRNLLLRQLRPERHGQMIFRGSVLHETCSQCIRILTYMRALHYRLISHSPWQEAIEYSPRKTLVGDPLHFLIVA